MRNWRATPGLMVAGASGVGRLAWSFRRSRRTALARSPRESDRRAFASSSRTVTRGTTRRTSFAPAEILALGYVETDSAHSVGQVGPLGEERLQGLGYHRHRYARAQAKVANHAPRLLGASDRASSDGSAGTGLESSRRGAAWSIGF